jgi:cytochrome P450
MNDVDRDAATYPFPSQVPGTLSEEIRRRHAEDPLGFVRLAGGSRVRLVVRYDDVKMVLNDRRFSRDLAAHQQPGRTASAATIDDPDIIANMDPPRHTRIRSVVSGAFSMRQMQLWEPFARRTADDLITAMVTAGPPADFVEQFCFPYPLAVFCEVFGLPDTDRGALKGWTEDFLSAGSGSARARAAAAFAGYSERVIARRREEPGETIIDKLIAAHGDGRLTDAELPKLITGLLAGGFEGVASVLSRSIPRLLATETRPGRSAYAHLVDDPTLVDAAVEEILRLEFPAEVGLIRVATEDVCLPSGPVLAGECVMPVVAAANRDSAVFPCPDRFDLDRAPQRPQVGLGHGPHLCLGANLVRVELRVAYAALVRRLPTLRLRTPAEDLKWLSGSLAQRPVAVPVVW